jgi:hypothetical protein
VEQPQAAWEWCAECVIKGSHKMSKKLASFTFLSHFISTKHAPLKASLDFEETGQGRPEASEKEHKLQPVLVF